MKIDNVSFLLSNNIIKKPKDVEPAPDNSSRQIQEKETSAEKSSPSPLVNGRSMFSRLMKLRLEVIAMKEIMSSSNGNTVVADGSEKGVENIAEDDAATSGGIAGMENSEADSMEGMLALLDELLGMDKLPGMSESTSEEKQS